MKKTIRNILFGVMLGCTISTLVSLVGVAVSGEAFLASTAQQYIRYVLAAVITGVGFSAPAAIYTRERLPLSVKVLVHMGVGLAVYFAAALWAGWIPLDRGAGMVVLFAAIAAAASFLIWGGFYLYHRGEARRINAKLQEREQR